MRPPSEKKSRETGIELCRIFCCLCVIAVHTSHFHPDTPAVSFVWTMAKCAATPVFFLITGYFFTPSKSAAAYMSRLVSRVVIPVIAVMLIIAQLTPWLSGQLSLAACMEALHWDNFARVGRIWLNFWSFDYLPDYNPFGPLWFTFAFIQCYLFFPLLGIVCGDGATASALRRYALWLGLVVFVLNVTIRISFPDNDVIRQLDWAMPQKPLYWLWLILVGHQARRFAGQHQEMLRRRRPLLIASGLAAYLAGGIALFWLTLLFNVDETGYVNQHFFAREFAVYLAAQLGMFAVFVLLPVGNTVFTRPILFVADKAFYIYVIHEAVFKKIRLHTDFDLTKVDEYLLFIIITFAVSFCIACVLKKIEREIASVFSSPRYP